MLEHTTFSKVTWGETDMAGIIYYPNYFNWFNNGSLEMFNRIGLSPRELMSQQKIGLPLLDVGCSFFKPLYFNDEIRVRSKLAEVNEKTFRLEHEVYRGNELTGKGHELRGWVHFDEAGNLRALPIPPKVREILTGRAKQRV